MIQIGQTVPALEGEAYAAGKFTHVKLSDYRGKWVVLYFYPLDFTFICPTEIKEFARRERITEKTFTSASKKRLAQAAGDTKVGEYVSIYERKDGSIGLARDYQHDEDRDYLLDKLYKFANRLKEAFGAEVDAMFPKPSARSKSEAAGQQTLGLFD